MRSSRRRSTPACGEGIQGSASVAITTRWVKSALTRSSSICRLLKPDGQSGGELRAPLPLAGEVDVRGRGGGGSLQSKSAYCGGTPTPTLPRKRERERSFI